MKQNITYKKELHERMELSMKEVTVLLATLLLLIASRVVQSFSELQPRVVPCSYSAGRNGRHRLLLSSPSSPSSIKMASTTTTIGTGTFSKKRRPPWQVVVLEPDQLGKLARSSSQKTIGSAKFGRAWRHWSNQAVAAIRVAFRQEYYFDYSNVKSNSSYSNSASSHNDDHYNQLGHDLGVAADVGDMPSGFGRAAARAGYALDFFCRARLLADLLVDEVQASSADWFSPPLARHELLFFDGSLLTTTMTVPITKRTTTRKRRRKTLRMTSIGGGPGYDFVAVAMVASFQNAISSSTTTSTCIDATILDYETGWRDIVDAMSVATIDTLQLTTKGSGGGNGDSITNHHHRHHQQHQHKCRFGGKCDITQPLTHSSNEACLAETRVSKNNNTSIHLWTCQYCVAENINALRAGNFVFFRNLFQVAAPGSLFFFTETTHRLWPEFQQLLEEYNDNDDDNDSAFFQVTFPKATGRKAGGYQMVIQKQAKTLNHAAGTVGANVAVQIDHQDKALLQTFARDRELHHCKMQKGYARETRKVRGAKPQ